MLRQDTGTEDTGIEQITKTQSTLHVKCLIAFLSNSANKLHFGGGGRSMLELLGFSIWFLGFQLILEYLNIHYSALVLIYSCNKLAKYFLDSPPSENERRFSWRW